MEQAVGGNDVVERFGAALRVDVTAHVGEIAEQVEAVEHQRQVAVHEAFGQSGVPYQFVGVHRRLAVATAGVERQVGGELEVPRQFQLGVRTVMVSKDIERLETLTVARGVLVGQAAACAELQLRGGAVAQ